MVQLISVDQFRLSIAPTANQNMAKLMEPRRHPLKEDHLLRHEEKKPAGGGAELEAHFGCPTRDLAMVGGL